MTILDPITLAQGLIMCPPESDGMGCAWESWVQLSEERDTFLFIQNRMYILDVVHKIGSQFPKCRNSVAHLTHKIEKTYLKLNVSDELWNKSQNLLD